MALPQHKIFNRWRGKPFRRLQREAYQRLYHYPHRNLLIVGQPKSGSTWLFNMVCELPGYLPWTPDYIKFEQHDLKRAWVENIPAGFTVTKTHTRPTEENIERVDATGRPYVVLLRDLRDIAVSWCFYVGNEANHPRHDMVKPLQMPERLDYFIETMLPEFAFWASTWHARHDGKRGLVVNYEELLADTGGQLGKVVRHFGVDLAQASLDGIVERFRFEKRTGRKQGEEDSTQFNRKGVSGDWRNHFSESHQAAFRSIAGDALVELGYGTGAEW